MFHNTVGYWYFKKAITKKDINKIEKTVSKIKYKKGTISLQSKPNLRTRDSDIKFFDNPFVYDLLMPFFEMANKNAGWNFKYDWCESVQYTKYGKNQHYGWHIDMPDKIYKKKDPNFNNKTRKLSCTLLLNDSSEYTGGKFQIDFRSHREKENIVQVQELVNEGDLLIFPSYLWHRVTPVTKGVRKSLVAWVIGPQFA